MHINFVRGDYIVGYEEDAYQKYLQKVEELRSNGYVLVEVEHCPSGDTIEHFQKEEVVYCINHLAV